MADVEHPRVPGQQPPVNENDRIEQHVEDKPRQSDAGQQGRSDDHGKG